MKPFYCTLVGNDQLEGVVVDRIFQFVQGEGGTIAPIVLLGVLWNGENERTPSPSYHPPEQLAWTGLVDEFEITPDDEADQGDDQGDNQDDDGDLDQDDNQDDDQDIEQDDREGELDTSGDDLNDPEVLDAEDEDDE